jgi:hypothetical protein
MTTIQTLVVTFPVVTFYSKVKTEDPNDDFYWIFANHIHIDSSIR